MLSAQYSIATKTTRGKVGIHIERPAPPLPFKQRADLNRESMAYRGWDATEGTRRI